MRACVFAWLNTRKQIGRIRRMTQWAKFRDISETKQASAWKWKERGAGGGSSGSPGGIATGDRGWSLAQGDRTKEEWRYAGVEEDGREEDGREDMIDVLGEEEDAPLLTTFAARPKRRGD